jgi:branched-chain amino acid transport system permease protein
MSSETDEELESQAQRAQEATPGGISEPGGPWQERWRRQYREFTAPVRVGLDQARTWYESLPTWAKALSIVALIAVAAMVPFILNATLGFAAAGWETIAVKIGIAALLALGLNVVVGFAGLLDLGYVAFFAIGAYTFAITSGAAHFNIQTFVNPTHPPPIPMWHMYMWLYFFVALVVAVGSGILLGAPTLRLRGDYLAIVTLGFGEIVRITANNLDSFTNGAKGINQIPAPAIAFPGVHYQFLGSYQSNPYYWLLLGVVVIWIFLLRRVNTGRVGRAWAAIREDEVAAAAMGVPTVRMKLGAFAMGAAVASFGGVIYAMWVGFISPDSFKLFGGDFSSVIILAMVVVGGMGGFAGPILGAALIVFLPEWLRAPLQDSRYLVFGLVLILVMIFRPQGLIPSKRRARELTGGELHEQTLYEAREEARR